MANAEYLTDFTVFLDDALAIHETKAMRGRRLIGNGLMVEHMVKHFLTHATPRIADGDFDKVGLFLG